MSVPPAPSRPGPVSELNTSLAAPAVTQSAWRLTTQKPSPPGVWAVAGWNHTGASPRSRVNTGWGNPSANRSRSVRSMSRSSSEGSMAA
jgi:hypothetical protein